MLGSDDWVREGDTRERLPPVVRPSEAGGPSLSEETRAVFRSGVTEARLITGPEEAA